MPSAKTLGFFAFCVIIQARKLACKGFLAQYFTASANLQNANFLRKQKVERKATGEAV